MRARFSRHAFRVVVVIFAAGIVIVGFEILDAFAGSAAATNEQGAAAPEEVPPVAGLVKVAIFLGVGAAAAMPLGRRLRAARGSQ